MNGIDKKDLLIMTHLRKNSRMTLTEIARNCKSPISTVYEKLKNVKNNIIKKNTCIIDFNKLGFYARAKFVLQSHVNHKKDLLEYLMRHNNVNSVYKINNGYDFLFEGVFRNMKDLEEFLETLHVRFKAKKCDTYYIIEESKREEFMSDPDSLHLVI